MVEEVLATRPAPATRIQGNCYIIVIVVSNDRFSGFVTVLRERKLPTLAIPAGYAALLDAYDLEAPLPRTLCVTGERHKFLEESGWRVYSPRYAPAESLAGHLRLPSSTKGST